MEFTKPVWRRLLPVLGIVVTAGCAQTFPRPGGDCPGGESCKPESSSAESPSADPGREIFTRTFLAHGGARLSELQDVAVALDGRWKFLIRRIQPLVTDFRYRVQSEERLLLRSRAYAADYRGPGGRKRVWRQPAGRGLAEARTESQAEIQAEIQAETQVRYSAADDDRLDVAQAADPRNTDPAVIGSTALTADSFFLFTLGPLALADSANDFRWLGHAREAGREYDLLYLELRPGLGESARDEVVLWVDRATQRTYRVQITLEGFATTRGANVDVSFLDYTERDGFLFPTRFFERVRAPIAIDAHAWQLTGLDVNRGLTRADLTGERWSDRALRPAQPFGTEPP